MRKTKACPFCSSDNIEVSVVDEESKSGYDSVECLNCGVEGMGWSINDWNKRTGNWISVDERLPNSDDTVLIKTECGEIFTAVYWFNDDGREWVSAFSRRAISDHPNECYEVAHWKPVE